MPEPVEPIDLPDANAELTDTDLSAYGDLGALDPALGSDATAASERPEAERAEAERAEADRDAADRAGAERAELARLETERLHPDRAEAADPTQKADAAAPS